MSQIQDILTLAIASLLLGTSTATAQYNTSNDDSSSMSQVTTLNGYEMSAEALNSNRATASEDAYSFTMTLPQTGSHFAKLSFSFTKPDRDHTIVPVPLDLKGTRAFVGTSTMGQAIGVKDTWIDETGTVWIELNSPVAAKTTLTVVLKPQKLLPAGQYVYGIAAYPDIKPGIPVFVDSGTVKI